MINLLSENALSPDTNKAKSQTQCSSLKYNYEKESYKCITDIDYVLFGHVRSNI